MTEVRLTHINNRYIVEAAGHANYDSYGQDIVCSAISALTFAFAEYIAELQEAKKCLVDTMEVEEGAFLLVVDGNNEDIYPAYRSMQIGLESIADTYPKNMIIKN